jgi:hypothetical protein
MDRKKIWPVLLIIVGVLIIVLVITNLNKNKGQNNAQNGTDNTGTTTKNITQIKQGNVEVTDVSITSDGSMTNVSGQVTNNDDKAYSIVDISVIFYDTNKTVLATAKGLIENLNAGVKKGFSSSITGDFSKASSYEVKVEKAQ